jgi:uncharacterized protein (TIGR00296 family)
MISEESGKFLTEAARETLRQFLQHRRVMDVPKRHPVELDGNGAVLVELYKSVPGTGARELKASAAALDQNKSVLDNVISAALAAVNDPRYSSLKLMDLPVIAIEISVIESMEDITSKDTRDYMRKIAVGTDGLYMEKGIMKGILMPKIPLERKWTVRESLENLCLKAGLLKDSWADPAARIYRFRPQIFKG